MTPAWTHFSTSLWSSFLGGITRYISAPVGTVSNTLIEHHSTRTRALYLTVAVEPDEAERHEDGMPVEVYPELGSAPLHPVVVLGHPVRSQGEQHQPHNLAQYSLQT